jgi:hypothetical protein
MATDFGSPVTNLCMVLGAGLLREFDNHEIASGMKPVGPDATMIDHR